MSVTNTLRQVKRALQQRRDSFVGLPQRLDQRADLADYDIGRFTWGHLTVTNSGPGTSLSIGQFCSFATGAHIILGGEHRSDFVTTYRFPAYRPFNETHGHLADGTAISKGAVVIGNDVWLGHQVLILSGVTIGDGAIVGAGSVVRHDLPPYSIAAGNPARVAGFRFSSEQIAALLEIRWWDWPLDRIGACLDLLIAPDIDAFIARARE